MDVGQKRKKMPFVYRYREYSSFNIRCLENSFINGSLFKTFSDKDLGEMNYGFSNQFINKIAATQKDAENFANAIINNTKKNYYLACFTLNPPRPDSVEWNKYAKGNGYCLVYRIIDIQKEIEKQVLKYNRTIMFKNVNYSDNLFLLDCVANEFLRIIKKYGIDTLEELDNKFSIQVNKDIGKHACKAFFHKSTNYRNFNEMRVVELDKNNNNPNYKDCLLVVKPIKIVIKKSPIPIDYSKIIRAAKQNGIPWEFI